MQTTAVNIKIDPEIKKKAQKVAEKSGYDLNILINDYLKKIVRTNSIAMNLEEPSAYLVKSLKESEEDIKNGWVSPTFDNIEDEIAWLNDPKAKYVNQLRKKV